MANQNSALRNSPSADLVQTVSQIVMEISGVQLGDRQTSMVQSRLQKRISDLKLSGSEEYLSYLNANRTKEVSALVSLLTTHHTYFFREFSHFEYLEQIGLKKVVAAAHSRGEKCIRIWSAASSRGQEVYSLAMFIKYHLARIAPDFTFEILGTDIDTDSIEFSKNGVYQHDEVKEIPMQFLSGNWAKGTGDIANYVKAKPSIKDHCRFEALNLIGFNSVMPKKFDIIFCRNVFIYFTPEQIKKVTQNLLNNLTSDGVLFIGISESLGGMGLPVQTAGPSVYMHQQAKSATKAASQAVAAPEQVRPEILRVLCVDDSPSVITLLKQILKKESGFEVVATAANGLEAAQRLRETKVDLITLDIHMPEQNGLEYLQKNISSSHPPVVMISSVSRENADLAMKCLEAGATDYVEKPALANIKERGEEIRMKLHCAYRTKQDGAKAKLGLDKSFAKHPVISQPAQCFRLVFGSLADRKKIQATVNEFSGNQPPTVILMEGCETALPSFAEKAGRWGAGNLAYIEGSLPELSVGRVYLADFAKWFDSIHSKYGSQRTSILVYGNPTPAAAQKIATWGGAHLMLEDLGKLTAATSLREIATDLQPATSFSYASVEFLSRDHGKK